MADFADCLAGQLRLPRAHVAGHSFGGALALECYSRHPEIPMSLEIVGGTPGGGARFLPTSSNKDVASASTRPSCLQHAARSHGVQHEPDSHSRAGRLCWKVR